MIFLMFEAGVSSYSSGGTVVTVSGMTLMGAMGGGDEGADAAIVVAGAAVTDTGAAAAMGAARLAAHPSLPRNLIDGLLANLTAVGNMVDYL